MTIAFDNFEELKRRVGEVQRQHDQNVGARNQLVKRLREEFQCKTLEEAIQLLEKYEEEERSLSVRFAKSRVAFEKKWKKVLEK